MVKMLKISIRVLVLRPLVLGVFISGILKPAKIPVSRIFSQPEVPVLKIHLLKVLMSKVSVSDMLLPWSIWECITIFSNLRSENI